MFIPNTYGFLSSITGMNGDGEPIFGLARRTRCAISSLNKKVIKTSVRRDSSASRGDAEETQLQSEIMFGARTTVSIDDRFAIAGFTMRVTGIEPCYDVNSRLDHYQVTLVTLVQ